MVITVLTSTRGLRWCRQPQELDSSISGVCRTTSTGQVPVPPKDGSLPWPSNLRKISPTNIARFSSPFFCIPTTTVSLSSAMSARATMLCTLLVAAIVA
ncbi:hypothetical protein MKW92_014981, partial [Papaver armeniacum]